MNKYSGTSRAAPVKRLYLGSTPHQQLMWQMKISEHLPPPFAEFRFHPTRRWRFDIAFPGQKIAVEVDGGIWIAGRHNRGAGMERDHEKINAAIELGWRVLRYTPPQIKSGEAIAQIVRIFAGTTQ